MSIRTLACMVLCAACGTTDAPAGLTAGAAGRIRMVNLSGTTSNALLEGLPFGVNLTYAAPTPPSLPAPSTALYSPILAGERTLILRATADTSLVVGIYDITIVAGQDRSVFAFGGLNTQFETVDTNSTALLSSSFARLRVVNVSPVAGPVDLFITAPTAALATATPVVSNVGPMSASTYFTFSPGVFRLRFVRAGVAAASRDANVVSNVNSATLAGGSARTMLLADAPPAAVTIFLTDQ